MKRAVPNLKLTKHWLIAFALFIYIPLHGQTTHQVEVSNFKFNPNELTIEIGDTVVWTNIDGTHNVNGTTNTFADNPDSFGNDVSSGWTYSFVFTKAGNYNYQCDPHASSGMKGTITVNGTTTSNYQIFASNDDLILYPNPVSTDLYIVLPFDFQNKNLAVSIFNVTGKQVYQKIFLKNSGSEIAVNTLDLTPGLYIVKLQSNSFEMTKRFFKQ